MINPMIFTRNRMISHIISKINVGVAAVCRLVAAYGVSSGCAFQNRSKSASTTHSVIFGLMCSGMRGSRSLYAGIVPGSIPNLWNRTRGHVAASCLSCIRWSCTVVPAVAGASSITSWD
jgi:hypothetical protein